VETALGNGDGSFQDAVSLSVGSTPKALVAADLNGDGRDDLAVANSNFGDLARASVLVSNGNGTFGPAQPYPSGGDAVGITARDFTGDGRDDLAVLDNGPYQFTTFGTVAVIPGLGGGIFLAPPAYDAGAFPSDLTSGDFNGDGLPD